MADHVLLITPTTVAANVAGISDGSRVSAIAVLSTRGGLTNKARLYGAVRPHVTIVADVAGREVVVDLIRVQGSSATHAEATRAVRALRVLLRTPVGDNFDAAAIDITTMVLDGADLPSWVR